MSTTPTPKPGENTDLAKLQAQIASQAGEIDKLKKRPAQTVSSQPVIQTGQPPTKEQIEEIFWKDPLAMTDAIARRAAMETEQRIMGSSAENNRMIARDKARESDPENFDLYEVAITAKVGLLPPQFQGNVSTWINALNLTKGEHTSEIIERKSKAGAGKGGGGVSDGPGSPSPKAPAAPKVAPLSDDEKQVIKGMRMTEDTYRRGKDRLANQEAKESSWKQVITFNSEDKRRAAAAASKSK